MSTSYVLVVRDPDSETGITTDGDVVVVSIDLGSTFDGTPNDNVQACEWITDRLEGLEALPAASNCFAAAVDCLTTTVGAFPEALALVGEYEEGRA